MDIKETEEKIKKMTKEETEQFAMSGKTYNYSLLIFSIVGALIGLAIDMLAFDIPFLAKLVVAIPLMLIGGLVGAFIGTMIGSILNILKKREPY